MKKIAAVIGPTATGKTDAAIRLCRKVGGEIVCCDSMQIYRYLDIGTAKPTAEERAMVPHHLTDFLDPEMPFNVSDWCTMARDEIGAIQSRGNLAVVCGGTGLYYSSLVKGLNFTDDSAPDEALREQIRGEYELFGLDPLISELEKAAPDHAHMIERDNPRRVLRSVELLRKTGLTTAQHSELSLKNSEPIPVTAFLLTHADRQALYARIEKRVDAMLAKGLLDEARTVWVNRETYRTAAAAIGYKEFFPYFEGTQTLEECTAKLKTATRRYAKRQLTWFKREQAHVIEMDRLSAEEAAGIMAEKLREEEDEER